MHVNVLVIGAGPTGLGAAWRLHETQTSNWLLVEREHTPGGAASSHRDEQGFVWDFGGHVIHSHFEYFDRALEACDIAWTYPQRNGWVYLAHTWIPVPLQQNIGALPGDLQRAVLAELSDLDPCAAANLHEYFVRTFGPTLAHAFFLPFNSKMWGHPPAALEHRWTSERSGSQLANVPPPSLTGGSPDRSHFPYPRYGSGSIWRAVADRLPPSQLRFGSEVHALDLPSATAFLADGTRITYEHLVSSMPLTQMLQFTPYGEQADQLLHSRVEIVGLGFQGPTPQALVGKSWIYNADPAVPFHRATVLSNYSPEMAGPGRWSLLLECSDSATRPLDLDALVDQCLGAVAEWGVKDPVSVWRRTLPMGYPAPFRGRDELCAPVMDHLDAHNVRSRGRFGGWRYESCNQDHAFMQGVQAVDALRHGAPEDVFWPDRIPA